MKRRRAIQSILGLPAVAAIPQPAQAQYASTPSGAHAPETPKLTETAPDAVGFAPARLFSAEQRNALSKLCEFIAPASGSGPGAVEAEVPEFLDFLISESANDRKRLYTQGLDRLNAEARRLYSKDFAQLTSEQAGAILSPLRAAWTYYPPPDSFARFLREAKDDILRATQNSRAWAQAGSSRRRSAAGLNTYWHVID